MNHISITYHKTPYGELIIGSYKDQLCMLDWRYRKMRESIDNRIKKGLDAIFIEEESDIGVNTIIEF